MKKRMQKKLTLSRETVQSLSDRQIGQMAGGALSGEFGPGCRTEFPNCEGTQATCPTDVGPCSYGRCYPTQPIWV